MTTTATTDRDRLTLAFADLTRHGIVARAAVAGTAPEGHALLRAELARRFPHGMGSYVFWARSDVHRFDGSGALTAALALHCSAEDVAVAVVESCRRAGIDARPDGDAAVLRLTPAR
jgi:hypothetical protein